MIDIKAVETQSDEPPPSYAPPGPSSKPSSSYRPVLDAQQAANPYHLTWTNPQPSSPVDSQTAPRSPGQAYSGWPSRQYPLPPRTQEVPLTLAQREAAAGALYQQQRQWRLFHTKLKSYRALMHITAIWASIGPLRPGAA